MSKKSLSKSLSLALIFIASPIIIIVLSLKLSYEFYYVPALALILTAILAFFLSFERKKVKTAELVIISVMIGICVMSRSVFAFAPQIKPLGAFVCISGIYLGAQTGFMVGAISMFVSNFLFGQGLYTAFQMLGMGLVGFLCGLIFYKKKYCKNSFLVSITAAVLCCIVYGLLVDGSSLLIMISQLNFKAVISVFATGFAFNLIHGLTVGTVTYFINVPMGKKFTRLRVKYEIFDF